MTLITTIQTQEKLTDLFLETLINTTDKVTKVAPNSVLGGVAAGIGKIAQTAIKETALVETHLFPDNAYGSQLDNVAEFNGVSSRFGPLGSSTYIRLNGANATTYALGTTFTGNSGIVFQLQETVVIGTHLYAFGRVSSISVGAITNVPAGSISQVNGAAPAGHISATNDYRATGGQDAELDVDFRKRIKDSANIYATGTLAKILQVFQSINSNVLDVRLGGHDNTGKLILIVQTTNGADLTAGEIDTILQLGDQFFNFAEMQDQAGDGYGIIINNIVYSPVDLSMRLELNAGVDSDQTRIRIQTKINKLFDPRLWNRSVNRRKVEWDDILAIVKADIGVKYVGDDSFLLNGDRSDYQIERFQIPRVRGFILMNLSGIVLSNISGTISPSFYPSNPDSKLANQVLRQI
tara:strand:- start:1099 stop:2322 length:1224 start_codon:yes stop_codon:yes gene_type:complete